MWQEVKRAIEHGRRFLLTTHVNPDGDGIGSAVALIELLTFLKKTVYFVSENPTADKYDFLNFRKLFKTYEEIKELPFFDTLIVLDTCKKDRIGKGKELADSPNIKTLWIDHHPYKESLPEGAVVDESACCVGCLIRSLFSEFGLPLNHNAASGIYVSILTDTGRFSYSSTNGKAHEYAWECLSLGVNPAFIFNQLYQQIPVEVIQVLQKAFCRMEFLFENRLLVQQVRYADYAHLWEKKGVVLQDFDFLHEFNRSIQGVLSSLIFLELPSKSVRVSLRTACGLNIVEPMRKLGGGGHPHAAGACVLLPFEEAKEKVLKLIEESCFL